MGQLGRCLSDDVPPLLEGRSNGSWPPGQTETLRSLRKFPAIVGFKERIVGGRGRVHFSPEISPRPRNRKFIRDKLALFPQPLSKPEGNHQTIGGGRKDHSSRYQGWTSREGRTVHSLR